MMKFPLFAVLVATAIFQNTGGAYSQTTKYDVTKATTQSFLNGVQQDVQNGAESAVDSAKELANSGWEAGQSAVNGNQTFGQQLANELASAADSFGKTIDSGLNSLQNYAENAVNTAADSYDAAKERLEQYNKELMASTTGGPNGTDTEAPDFMTKIKNFFTGLFSG